MFTATHTYMSAKEVVYGLAYGMSSNYIQRRYVLEMFWGNPNEYIYEYSVVRFATKPTKRQVRKAIKQFKETQCLQATCMY